MIDGMNRSVSLRGGYRGRPTNASVHGFPLGTLVDVSRLGYNATPRRSAMTTDDFPTESMELTTILVVIDM